MRGRNPYVPQIAQSCPNINAIQDLCKEIGMYVEDVWNHYENEDEGAMSDNIDHVISVLGDIANDVEEIRLINSDLRDAATELANDLWDANGRIEELEKEIIDLERML